MRWRGEPRMIWWAAVLVAAALLLLNFGALGAVLWRAETGARLSTADWSAARFTVWQAVLSAVISVALAIPVARGLARRRFFGRSVLIVLMGAPFILPVLVAVIGLLAVFGRSGVFNDSLALIGVPPFSIYGLHGVVLAHVFFNLPLSVRLLLQGWARIPAEHLRLSSALGFGGWARFRHIEAPMLLRVVPGALAVVFLICLTSFAVALTLGGGPAATTLELAIYQAFRFDFDLGRAALLALLQASIGIIALLLLARFTLPDTGVSGLDRIEPAPPGGVSRIIDGASIGIAAAFLLIPLAMVILRGIPHVFALPAPVWLALWRSLLVAALSVSVLALMTGTLTMAALLRRWPEGIGMAALVSSPLVIGTGLFIVIHPLADPASWALTVTALVNAAMALPFALRAVLPAARRAEADFARLSASLGVSTGSHMRLILWPRLRRPFGFAMGLGAALSLGDFGVIVLFAQTGGETLPMQVQRLLGAYRNDDAAGAALVLLAVALLAFVAVERIIGGKDARA